MVLGVFFMGSGHHIAAWRHLNTPHDGYENIDFYIDLAKMAEISPVVDQQRRKQGQSKKIYSN